MDNNIVALLKAKAKEYEDRSFITLDPITIPHRFSQKEDIEIAAFFTAILSWGNRKSIIKSAERLMEIMGDAPYEFVMNYKDEDLNLPSSIHRTFLAEDFLNFTKCLQNIYTQHQGLEAVFTQLINKYSMDQALYHFKLTFLGDLIDSRTQKHLPNPLKGSAAKRVNMFLRWMVRSNAKGVDFALWKGIEAKKLYLPLDVHTGNVARKLNLLERKQNDWKALEELMQVLRKIDKNDPVSLDFALFGLGVYDAL